MLREKVYLVMGHLGKSRVDTALSHVRGGGRQRERRRGEPDAVTRSPKGSRRKDQVTKMVRLYRERQPSPRAGEV